MVKCDIGQVRHLTRPTGQTGHVTDHMIRTHIVILRICIICTGLHGVDLQDLNGLYTLYNLNDLYDLYMLQELDYLYML